MYGVHLCRCSQSRRDTDISGILVIQHRFKSLYAILEVIERHYMRISVKKKTSDNNEIKKNIYT